MILQKGLWIVCGLLLVLWIILPKGTAGFFGLAGVLLIIVTSVIAARSRKPIVLLDADGEIVTRDWISEKESSGSMDAALLAFAGHIVDGARIDREKAVFMRDSDDSLILLYDVIGDNVYTRGSMYDRECLGELRSVQMFSKEGALLYTFGADVFKKIRPPKGA